MKERHELPPDAPATALWHVDLLGGLDVFWARNRAHHFPRHFHDTYVVQIVDRGVCECDFAGRTYHCQVGDILLFNPGDVHTGQPVGDAPLSYRCLYPRRELMAEAARSLGRDYAGRAEFARPVVHDPPLADRIRRLHDALIRPGQRLAAEGRLVNTLAELLQRTRQAPDRPLPHASDFDPVLRVQEFIRANLCENLTLEHFEDVARLSRFHLLRVFRRHTGLPPHEYLMSLRVERARHLLARQWPIARAALESGFADQSHLTRCFKRLVGITPGRLVRMSNFVQDPPA